MKLAIDVYYYPNRAKVVGILFKNWDQPIPNDLITTYIYEVSEYESGMFYKRELSCILELLKQINLKDMSQIIVDGFVYLDDTHRPGLGKYLFDALEEKIPIIGVAKNPFSTVKSIVQEITRGESKKPLYISSIGISLNEASQCIQNMHGNFRIPTLLKLLDQETRK